MTTRTIDALCDQFVEDYAALDPVSATAFGVAGHDDRLTDLSPAGYDARVELVRAAVEAVEAATPVELVGFEIGVMDKKDRNGNVTGAQVWYRCQEVRALASTTPRQRRNEAASQPEAAAS